MARRSESDAPLELVIGYPMCQAGRGWQVSRGHPSKAESVGATLSARHPGRPAGTCLFARQAREAVHKRRAIAPMACLDTAGIAAPPMGEPAY